MTRVGSHLIDNGAGAGAISITLVCGPLFVLPPFYPYNTRAVQLTMTNDAADSKSDDEDDSPSPSNKRPRTFVARQVPPEPFCPRCLILADLC